MHKQLSSDDDSVHARLSHRIKPFPRGRQCKSSQCSSWMQLWEVEQMGPCVQTERVLRPSVVGVELRECQALKSPGNHLFLGKLIN